MHEALLGIVKAAALMRCSWLLIGLARVIPVHAQARTRKWGLSEVLTFAELPLFLALTGLLFFRPPAVPQSGTGWFTSALGAALALAGLLVSLWAIYTTYRVGVILDAGHFVKEEHPLITTGAYGLVRNPMYLGILLIWFGIAAAFEHLLVLLVAVAYVVPTFSFYIRAEERMMLSEFGARYRRYMQRVGRLFPRLDRSNG